MQLDGYCLRGPKGKLHPATFRVTHDEATGACYDYLYNMRLTWARKPKWWKNWDGFVSERESRGWRVVPVKITVAEESEYIA